MFDVGIGERLRDDGTKVVRHSVVHVHRTRDEDSRGIHESHPICAVILRLEEFFGFRGSWVTSARKSALRPFEIDSKLIRLRRCGWTVDDLRDDLLRASRPVSRENPWPYDSSPALPSPQNDILFVGAALGHWGLEPPGPLDPLRANEAETMVERADVIEGLAREGCHAVYLARTQSNGALGISIVGPAGLDPLAFIPPRSVEFVYKGDEAGRAWTGRST